MLNPSELRFPITVNSYGIGIFCIETMYSKVMMNGELQGTTIEQLFERNAKYNPNNKPEDDYYVKELGGLDKQHDFSAAFGVKGDYSFISSAAIAGSPDAGECAIEKMPIGASIMGYFDGDDFVKLAFTPKHIEVHDDVIILLLHYGAGSKSRVAGEVNLPRGTRIRFE